MNVVNIVRRCFLVRLLAHLCRSLTIGAIIAALTGFAAYGVLKLLAVERLFAAKVGIAEGAAYIGLGVGLFAAFISVQISFPPGTSCGLRKGHRYRVKKFFSAGEHQFRAGDVLVFKREWATLIYEPETEDELEQQGRAYYSFDNERQKANAASTAIGCDASFVLVITSDDFAKTSDWTQFLEELPNLG